MDKADKEALSLLINTVVVSMKTSSYHIGVLANICNAAGLDDELQWCRTNYKSMDGFEKHLKKIQKKIVKSGVELWKED